MNFFESDSEALPSGFPLDVVENDQEFTVKANMAGFDPRETRDYLRQQHP